MDAPIQALDRATDAHAGRAWTMPIAWQGRALDLVCCETLADLAALEGEWRALERQAREPFAYFQSFDWCMTWCRTFLADEAATAAMRAEVYVLREDGACLMLWPLMTRRVGASVTVLTPLTAPMNQYATLLFDTARFDVGLGRAVLDTIRRRGGRDAICLDHLPQSSLLAEILDGQGVRPADHQQSSIFDFAGITDWESHHRGLPKKQRLQRNSRRNRLEKLGTLDYRVYPSGSEGYAELIDRCIAMKQEWLKGTGRLGRDVFDPRFATFLRNLGAGGSEDDGRAFLHALTLDGAPIAMELGMRFRQDYYCFLGAIDLAYQKYSPGKVQMENAQRWAIETGIHRFDFLNDPSAYKASWTNCTEPLTASYIPLTGLGQLYCRHWMAGLRPQMRSLYHRIGTDTRARLLSAVGALQRFFGRNAGSMSLVLCCLP